MNKWLNIVKVRLGFTVCCWHQGLSALGCFSVLAVVILAGLQIDTLGPRFFSLISPAVLVCHEGKSLNEVLPPPSIRQELGTGKDLRHTQDPVSSKINPALPPLLQDVKSPLAGTSPSVSLPLSVPCRLPEKLVGLGIEDRKKLFIDLLLPTVIIALDEVKQERQQLLSIIAELGGLSTNLSFAEDNTGWQQRLGMDKSKFMLTLTRKYRTDNADELVAMVNVLPPSLIIAQGAIESAWGASRFANEVNNLFGMYASVNTGQTSSHDASKAPKIMEYESILDSVRSYVLTINRLSAYKELRRIRCQTLDPMLIAEGLTQYSERKEYYIADIKQIISRNNLRDFDTLVLAAV